MRPRLLDLFCGAGGAAMGYHRAGFEVIGVDINSQPNYPFPFYEADALEFVAKASLGDFDAIHASPPCQRYSALRTMTTQEHPDLVGPTRELLQQSGLPYVIENVPGSPLIDPIVLCGSETWRRGFMALGAQCKDGQWRQLRRHRLFESSVPLERKSGCRHEGPPVGVYGTGGGGQMTRGYKGDLAESQQAMGIDWMGRKEISQAIPPAYTEHIGTQLLAHIATPSQEAA